MSVPLSAENPAPGRFELRGGIAWLVLDEPGKKVNTLSTRLFGWFSEQLDRLEREPAQGLVIVSGKPDGFVAGADLDELSGATSQEEILDVLRRGHELLARLGLLPFPTVAAIHGAALGGGLELALACRYRIATDHPKTKLGLPEVQLGLIPGLGGTQRLPRLIGVPDALDLILTGRQVDARKARKLGLVDDVCHPSDLATAALRWLRSGPREAKAKPKKSHASRAGALLARVPVADRLIWEKAEKGVLEKTGGHYPAPRVAIAIVREGLKLPLARGLELESGAFAALAVTETAKNLISIFFAKNQVEARAGRLAKGARPGWHAGVLGAGLMGSGIAQVLSDRGAAVLLKDRDAAALARGVKAAAEYFEGKRRRRRLTEAQAKEALARIHPTLDARSFAGADLVIEAVFEDLKIKHAVLHDVESAGRGDLIFASNTSAIPIGEIAQGSRRPENVVGLHFFSPVPKMPLLEVVRHPGTSAETLATAVDVGRKMGKTTIVVNDGPGFFTSRVLAPFCNEACWLLAEGARIDQVDRALKDWGWPVGPFTLMDEVGLDVGAHVGGLLHDRFGERLAPPPIFARLIEDGRLGRKAGKGFYLYPPVKKGKKEKGPRPVDETVYRRIGWNAAEISDPEIVERCVFQMLNETARTLSEKIVENPADVDIGVIFGFGFPPFRGGLLRYADAVGLAEIVEKMDRYAMKSGERLAPAPLLREMAAEGKTFYPRGARGAAG
jgi:3-hydroxyacyl-CoA dehydrogenase/enoyl-CoA hydratase/3-hydroxybutyryl-CoA epimerase